MIQMIDVVLTIVLPSIPIFVSLQCYSQELCIPDKIIATVIDSKMDADNVAQVSKPAVSPTSSRLGELSS